MTAATARIPVSLITGFLGSGKSTLIAALLKQPQMAGTAVVVNEFGAVGIDDAVFVDALEPDDVVLLANGCLCCAAGDDLADTVWRLSRRSDRPSSILIETSGLADPAPALRRLMADPRLRQVIRLDALVATIDAVAGPANLDDRPIAARQCAVADRRVVTKVDLASPDAVRSLAERLRGLNPGAPVLFAEQGRIAPDLVFGAGLIDPATGRADADRWLGITGHRAEARGHDQGTHSDHAHGHDHAVRSWLVEEERPVDWEILSSRLGGVIARYGDRLLRLKGIVQTTGDERPLVVHGVQRVFHAPVRLTRWSRTPATSIVVIGDGDSGPMIDLIRDAVHSAAAGAPVGRRPADHGGMDAGVSGA